MKFSYLYEYPPSGPPAPGKDRAKALPKLKEFSPSRSRRSPLDSSSASMRGTKMASVKSLASTTSPEKQSLIASQQAIIRQPSPSFLLPLSGQYGAGNLQYWLSQYTVGREAFASPSTWARTKLIEMQQLVETQMFPPKLLHAVVAQMLVQEESPNMLQRDLPTISCALTHLFKAMFMLTQESELMKPAAEEVRDGIFNRNKTAAEIAEARARQQMQQQFAAASATPTSSAPSPFGEASLQDKAIAGGSTSTSGAMNMHANQSSTTNTFLLAPDTAAAASAAQQQRETLLSREGERRGGGEQNSQEPQTTASMLERWQQSHNSVSNDDSMYSSVVGGMSGGNTMYGASMYSSSASPSPQRSNPMFPRRKEQKTSRGSKRAIHQNLHLFLRCPTYSGMAQELVSELDEERELRPELESRMTMRRQEKTKELRSMYAAIHQWQRPMTGLVFVRWKAFCQSKRNRRKMAKVFTAVKAVKVDIYFNSWRNWAKAEHIRKEVDGLDKKKHAVTMARRELDEISGGTKKLTDSISSLKSTIERLKRELEEANKIVKHPARYPPTLQAVVNSLGSALGTHHTLLGGRHKHGDTTTTRSIADRHVHEMRRVGPDTVRLAPIYYRLPEGVNLAQLKDDYKHEQEHEDEDLNGGSIAPYPKPEAGVDDVIQKWIPGTFKGTEETPAFKPFHSMPGKHLFRWVNHELSHATSGSHETMPKKLEDVNGLAEVTDGHSYLALLRAVDPDPVVKQTISNAMLAPDDDDDDAPEGSEGEPPLESKMSMMEVMDHTATASHDMHARERSELLLNLLRRRRPPLGRYASSQHITRKKPPPTKAEIERAEKLKARLAKRELETGVVVHVMSKYMGQRVHVNDTSVQRQFLLQAEMFARYYGGGIGDKHDQSIDTSAASGSDDALMHLPPRHAGSVHTLVGKQHQTQLHRVHRASAGIMDALDRICGPIPPNAGLAGPTPVLDFEATGWGGVEETEEEKKENEENGTKKEKPSHSALETLSEIFKRESESFERNCGGLSVDWHDCYDDRRKYTALLPDLMRNCWQALCTTVLSHRVREEEDLDDGTFTKVERVQLASELRRVGYTTDEEQDLELKEVSDELRLRIRDLKRIFAFYAAAGDGGSATSLDNSEWWRFVKDCKMQKDRRKVPSSRVDLVFQACNIDYSLQGKDRLKSGDDDGEMQAQEWIEGIIRMSLYVYTSGKIGPRVHSLMVNYILPYAATLNTDIFRERMGSDSVTDVFDKYKPQLRAIYKEYSADDQTDDAVLQADTMNLNELVGYCSEIKLIGPLFSIKSARTLFAYLQQEEELLEEDPEDQGSSEAGDSELVFAEFRECQGGLAAFTRPDPYNMLDQRLFRFLREGVIPEVKAMQRFRGGKLPVMKKGL